MTRANLLKLTYLAGASRLLRLDKKNRLTILSIHRISDEKDYFFNPISPSSFENLVKYALKYYNVISFSDLSELKKPLAKPPLIFSFDDGYYDFYEYALPILKKYDLPSNHNIVNECAGSNKNIWTQRLNKIFNHCRDNNLNLSFNEEKLDVRIDRANKNWTEYYLQVFRHLLGLPKAQRIELIEQKEQELSLSSNYRMMNWKEIAECTKHRVEIGSHTYTHDILSTILDKNTLEFEIMESKKEIERQIKKPIDIIALPNGQGNLSINNFVEQSGYKYLLYVNDAINDLADIAETGLTVFERVTLVEESYFEMILRTELFHRKLRNYV